MHAACTACRGNRHSWFHTYFNLQMVTKDYKRERGYTKESETVS